MLEPYDAKASRTVPRRGGRGNLILLFDNGMELGFSSCKYAETDGHCTPGLKAAPKTSQLSGLWNLETPIRSRKREGIT